MPRRTQPAGRLERFQALMDSSLGHLLVKVTVASLVFLVAGIVMRQARAYTYRLDDFRVHGKTVEFTGMPDWADSRIAAALEPRMFGPMSVSIYNPDAEDILRARIKRHPMVRSVQEVRLLYPNRARIEPILRVPVARVLFWVKRPKGHQVMRWRLLSNDGCLLPRGPYKGYLEGLPYELPLVSGITEPAPLDPGEVWEDRTERVQEAVAAARVARRLYRDLRGRVTVTRIDVSRFPAESAKREGGEVRLGISCPPETRGGKRVQRTVEWGRTERACAEVFGEDCYEQKLERLRRALTTKRPPRFIDVRWELTAGGRTHP